MSGCSETFQRVHANSGLECQQFRWPPVRWLFFCLRFDRSYCKRNPWPEGQHGAACMLAPPEWEHASSLLPCFCIVIMHVPLAHAQRGFASTELWAVILCIPTPARWTCPQCRAQANGNHKSTYHIIAFLISYATVDGYLPPSPRLQCVLHSAPSLMSCRFMAAAPPPLFTSASSAPPIDLMSKKIVKYTSVKHHLTS